MDIPVFVMGLWTSLNNGLVFKLGTSGNHTPSIKPILPERVPLSSGNEISIKDDSTGDELHDRASEVQLTGMVPEGRNHNTVQVQFEA